jgi:D-amino peptidase
MKLYILTDIEGVAGVTQWEHCTPTGRYYDRSRRLLTGEVNAAVEGALEAGVTEVVVWDGHGSGGVEIEYLHPEAKLLMGRGQMLGRTLGMDESYDAVFFIGQHAMNRVPHANLCHTYNSRLISNMWLNGLRVGEFGLRTIVAGCLGLPVMLLTGDDCACEEAKAMVPEMETVAVKKSYGREYAISLSPAKAQEAIREGARRAIERLDEIAPYIMEGPWELKTEVYDLAQCKEGDRSFDRPIGDVRVIRSDNFLDISR